MKVFHNDEHGFPLPRGHRFPLRKYALLRTRLIESGVIAHHELARAPALPREDILRTHDPGYVARVLEGRLTAQETRRIGIPWSPALAQRARLSLGATLAACRAALRDGLAAHLGGGTHHAHADRGAGYCVFNDVVVALRVLEAEGSLSRSLIIDADAHQGDGTAALLADEPWHFTLSLHAAESFPARKQRSDLDLALPQGTGDAAYLAALERGLAEALSAARPDLLVYLAGADPWEGDRLGGLGLTREGLARRDRRVLAASRETGVPLAVVLAGGYAPAVEDTVAIHLQSLRIVCGRHES